MLEIAPSLLSADFSCLQDDIKKVEDAGVKYLHFDVMDGHFVPNITIGPLIVKAMRKKSSSIFDVHLMIDNPDDYLEVFKEAGADIITVHYEACTHLHRTVTRIRELGAKAGVSINPATRPDVLEYILSEVDLVLVMSVNPGFGGQKFIPSSIDKIKAIKAMIDKKKLDVRIEVDGGIDTATAGSVVSAGAEILVAGSAVFNTENPGQAVKEILSAGQHLKNKFFH